VTCKAAYLSRYGSIAGVPVAVGGILFFTWVLLMLWGGRGKSAIKDSAPAYIFAGSTLALAVVLYLAYASFFVLHEVCPLCVATYVAVIGVFVIAGGASSVPMSSLPSRLLRDMRVLVATPLALVVALLFIAGASWGMTVFPRETERPAVQQITALTEQQNSELARWWDLQPKSSNFPYENQGAKVLVVEFADFQCPHCREAYFGLKPVLDKYLASNPKDVKFMFKTWPLNSNCNASVPVANFVASCDASALYVMARQKGTADTVKDWFFLHQAELSPDTVRNAAKDVAKVPDFQAGYDKAIQEVKTDAAIGTSLGVHSTPTFFINGRGLPAGAIAPQYLDSLIQLELSRAK
jgi:disulfide bond formation protein DsbB